MILPEVESAEGKQLCGTTWAIESRPQAEYWWQGIRPTFPAYQDMKSKFLKTENIGAVLKPLLTEKAFYTINH